jgi:MFS family permease
VADSPSPYAPGIIADERTPPRPAGRPVVFLVATFVMGVATSPTSLLERVEPAGIASVKLFFAVASAPRVLMLLWAFLSDRVPLWGTRREGYVLFAALLTALVWLLAAVAGDRQWVSFIGAALFGAASAVSHAAMSGGLAEIGQRRAATGRLSAAYIVFTQLGVMATFFTPAVSELVSPWMLTGVAIALSLAVVVLIIALPDDAAAPPSPVHRPSIPRFLASRAFWSSFAICALAGAAAVPNELFVEARITPEHVALVGVARWMIPVAFVSAAPIYFLCCRWLRFGVLLRITLTVKALAVVAYPLVAGASGPEAAPIAFLARAAANGLLSVALLDMAFRVAPRGREAFATILLAGVTTIVITLTNSVETALRIPAPHAAGFAAAAAILAAIAAWLLPRPIVATPDGRMMAS